MFGQFGSDLATFPNVAILFPNPDSPQKNVTSARGALEPVRVPVHVHADDRRQPLRRAAASFAGRPAVFGGCVKLTARTQDDVPHAKQTLRVTARRGP